jgi:hypothetical protein
MAAECDGRLAKSNEWRRSNREGVAKPHHSQVMCRIVAARLEAWKWRMPNRQDRTQKRRRVASAALYMVNANCV